MTLDVAPPVPRRLAFLAVALLVGLSLVSALVMLISQQSLTSNLWGVPVDDAYIHFQYARNLATGHGFAFNPDQPMPGSTSPLWVVLLAIPTLAGVPIWFAAKVLGVTFLAVAAVLTWRLAMRFTDRPGVALTAGILTAIDGRLAWAAPSGMEVTLFAAVSVGAFLARQHIAERGANAGRLCLLALLCGLAANARPEGYLLAALLLFDVVIQERPRLRDMAVAGTVFGALVLPYIVFCLATTGRPLPTTFYAKAGTHSLADAWTFLLWQVRFELLTNVAIVLMAPVGAVVLWRLGKSARLVVLWPLSLLLVQAALSPLTYHFGRYTMPLDPFFDLWAAIGMARLTRVSSAGDRWRSALPALVMILLGLQALSTWWTGFYAHSVKDINTMQVALGSWVGHHTPPGAPIALNDIGAITYVGGRPAIDVVGLVSPQFIALQHEIPAERAQRDVYAEIKRLGARYLIIFPGWYPELARQPGLHELRQVTIPNSLIEAAPTMVVYAVA
jgi:hypothetical protein